VNPELLRNLWLQFSVQRSLAAPIILGAVVALLSFAPDKWATTAWVARGGFFLIAYLWGARRAVNVLADEITAGTWDGQRMSSIGPWTMAWGKLVGGTAYVWYCAGICLLAYLVAEVTLGDTDGLAVKVALQVTGAVFVQAVALLLALLLVGKGRRLGRRSVAFAQGAAIFFGFFGVSHLLLPSIVLRLPVGVGQTITWFGFDLPFDQFILLTQCLFLAWALVGVYRLMASELQVPQWPWVWILFSLFLIAYYQGLLAADSALSLRLVSALLVAVPLYYVAVFAQPHDVVRYRWLLHHNRGSKPGRTWSLMPLWAPSLVIAIIIAARLRYAEAITAMAHPELRSLLAAQDIVNLRDATTALLFFMVRDLGIVLLLNFSTRPKNPDLTAILYLIVLYVVGGGLAAAIGAPQLLPWFIPGAGNGLLTLVAPLLEAIAVFALVWQRWVAQGHALQPAA
jgi:hypothetical protein